MSDIVLIAIITAVFGTINTLLQIRNNKKVEAVHTEMNGMKEKLIDNAKVIGKAEGKAEEQANEKERKTNP